MIKIGLTLSLSLKIFILLLFMGFKTGDQVPDFSALNQDGKTIHLSDYRGKFVVIYFYPKDGTPGCTKEAQNFSSSYKKFASLKTIILGVSGQDQASHKEFKAKESIPYDLLVDTDAKLASLLQVGTIPVLGLSKRQTLLIDPEGKLLHFYEDVDPSTHVEEILKEIEKQKKPLGK